MDLRHMWHSSHVNCCAKGFFKKELVSWRKTVLVDYLKIAWLSEDFSNSIMIKFYCRGYSVPTTSKNMHLGTILGGKISHQYTDFPQPILYYCDIDRVSFHRIVFFKCTNLYLPDRIFSLELFNRTTYTYQSLSILRHNKQTKWK